MSCENMISVVLPIYNVEPYLEKCLRSILTNTYRDLEVICVNDGSTDGCLEILRRLQREDSRIIVINQENRGLEEARNAGLRAATGDYIAFIDSDDWVHPLYFESMFNCMQESHADVVACEYQRVNADDEIRQDLSVEPRYHQMTAKEFYQSDYQKRVVWAKLYRRRDAGKLIFVPEVHHAQDSVYNLRLIAGLPRPVVYTTDARLYYYLQREGALWKSRSSETWTESADWYVNNRRSSRLTTNGEWGWILPAFLIKGMLICRYEAHLRSNKELVRHADRLLRIMNADVLRDRFASLQEKLVLSAMVLLPRLYRRYRLIKDPSMKQYERRVREDI